MILRCENLSIGYGNKVLLDKINFEIQGGEYICVIGQNGAGKTTLLKTILGLIPPKGGEIVFEDKMGFGNIGYLPQQEQIQRDFPASVREVVMSGFQSSGKLHFFYSKEEKMKADELMKILDVHQLAKESFAKLSGGQRQRVLLVRALCAGEEILFLDEPVSGLDPDMRLNMYKLIQRVNTELGKTIFMISHDMDAVEKYATHILSVGNNTSLKTVEEYFTGLSCVECCECIGEDNTEQ